MVAAKPPGCLSCEVRMKVVSLLAAGKAASDGAAVHTHPFAPGAFGHRAAFDWKIHRADSGRIMPFYYYCYYWWWYYYY